MLLFHILLHVGIVFAACAADPNQRSSIGVNKIGVQRKGKNLAAGDIRPGVALENTAYEGGSGPTNTIKGGQGPSDGAPQGGETGVQQSSNDITQAGQGGSQGQGGLKQAAQVQGDQGQAQGGAQSSFTSPSPASTSSLPPSQSSQAPTSGGESSGNTGGGFKASFTGYATTKPPPKTPVPLFLFHGLYVTNKTLIAMMAAIPPPSPAASTTTRAIMPQSRNRSLEWAPAPAPVPSVGFVTNSLPITGTVLLLK